MYRSPWAIAVAAGWAAVGLLVVGDALLRESSGSPLPGLLVVVAVTGVVWSLFVRPCVEAGDAGVVVRNVVRDVAIPWPRLVYVDAPLTLTLHDDDDRAWRSWAISASSRPRRHALAARPAFGPTPELPVGSDPLPAPARALRADVVVRELTDLQRSPGHGRAGGVTEHPPDDGVAVVVSLAWAGLLPLLVSVACVVVLVLP